MPKVQPSVGRSCMALSPLNPPFPIHLNPASPKKVRPSALPPVANIPATFANPLQHRPLVLSYYEVYLADARPPALGISARRQVVVFQKLIASPCFQVSLCSLRFPTTMSFEETKNEDICNHWSTLSFAFVCSELPHCFHHIGAPLLSSRFRNL